jgi:AsmA protein
VQVRPVLKALQVDQALAGRANVTADLAMRGDSVSEWLATLSGTTRFALNDGQYFSANIEHLACQAIALARNERLTAEWPAQTTFKSAAGEIEWTNGVGKLQKLEAGLPILSLAGSGVIDLPQMAAEIDIDANLSGDVSGFDPGCAINESYRDIAWPLECKHAGGKSGCSIDEKRLKRLVAEAAKKDLRRQAEKKVEKKLQKELGDDLGKELKGALEGLFR